MEAKNFSTQLHSSHSQIAILDFGSQYSHLIARRLRELNVFCELYSCLVDAETLSGANVVGIVFSGGPSSVYEPEAPHVRNDVWEFIESRNMPVLGVCYGLQEMASKYGGLVSPSAEREYGRSMVTSCVGEGCKESWDLLFEGVSDPQFWMSHGDKVTSLPRGFISVARTGNSEHAAIACLERKMFGVQFHPEVSHSTHGMAILRNFAVNVCNSPCDWNMADIAEEFIRDVRELVGPDNNVIGAVSGGVDSSVAAVLMHRAIGSRFHAIMVDNGCLRKNESAEVVRRLKDSMGINLHLVDASDRFLAALEGVTEPEQKRKIIGANFIEIFQEEANRIGKVDFLLQGTLYPDVIESTSYKGPSATIKTHHNVGGLPDTMKLKLIEPLRELFKDEVRKLGIAMGIEHVFTPWEWRKTFLSDEASVWRHPFPGPGLAIRVISDITRTRLDTLREADAILIEELNRAGVYRTIGQAFVVLLPVQSVGVMGDCRTYENVCAIRCVTTSDFMTADWYHMDYELLGRISGRIINEVKGINRVCYDISSKPPATIEWE